jgi:hypothetical protein
LLRGGQLSAVYHGEHGVTAVQELGRSYTTLTEDTTRVMARLKAVYRGRAIATAGKKLYGPHRGEWLAQLDERGVRRRTELLYQQLDALQALRRQARQDLIVESRQHEAVKQFAHGSLSGSDPSGVVAGESADTVSVSNQATVLDLLRAGAGNAQQRRLPLPEGSVGAPHQARAHSRTELEP